MDDIKRPAFSDGRIPIIILWLAISVFYSAAYTQISKPKKVGDWAPEFSLTTLDGEVLTCDSLQKKTWVITFFTFNCDVCLEELPVFDKKIWQVYRDKGINIIAVGRRHTFDELKAFRDSTQYSFPMAPDSDRTVFKKFANIMIPRNIIIGKDGRIKFHIVGMNEHALKEMIRIVDEELNNKVETLDSE